MGIASRAELSPIDECTSTRPRYTSTILDYDIRTIILISLALPRHRSYSALPDSPRAGDGSDVALTALNCLHYYRG